MTIHETAIVEEGASVGEGTNVWHHSHVRKSAVLGKNCNLGKNVYIDINVKIGNNVKFQNNVSVYDGVTIEDDVFVGPHVVFTNDLTPRAHKWEPNKERHSTLVKKGASIGANATIVCGERVIGEHAMVGAGSVVTKNVPPNGLVFGNPARLRGFVCDCARRLSKKGENKEHIVMFCEDCDKEINIPASDFALLK